MIAIICIALALLCVLLTPAYCSFSVRITDIDCTVHCKLGFVFGIITIPFDFRLGQKKRKHKKNNILRSILKNMTRCFRVREVNVRSKIGIKDNAFLTVMAVGFLRIFFENIVKFGKVENKSFIHITPCFSTGIFWIYLEGIVTIFPTQIIGILLSKGR